MPHRFTLTGAEALAVCFLWHFPAGHPGSLLATTLPCGARTFLDGWLPPRPSGRLVRAQASVVRISLVAALLGALTLLIGLLPLSGAVDVTERVAPVLLFLVAVTVLAALADAAQVFDVATVRPPGSAAAARLRRTPAPCALGTVTTIVLSLDATAVLFTPVVLALAARLRLSPLPFAMAASGLPTRSARSCRSPTSPIRWPSAGSSCQSRRTHG